MNRILKLYPYNPITSARRIVDTRNFLIHGYDSLREDLVWGIVIRHLPSSNLKGRNCWSDLH